MIYHFGRPWPQFIIRLRRLHHVDPRPPPPPIFLSWRFDMASRIWDDSILNQRAAQTPSDANRNCSRNNVAFPVCTITNITKKDRERARKRPGVSRKEDGDGRVDIVVGISGPASDVDAGEEVERQRLYLSLRSDSGRGELLDGDGRNGPADGRPMGDQVPR